MSWTKQPREDWHAEGVTMFAHKKTGEPRGIPRAWVESIEDGTVLTDGEMTALVEGHAAQEKTDGR